MDVKTTGKINNMKVIQLNETYLEELLKFEEQMYWLTDKWNKFWQNEAKEKFRFFINDYLTNFPQGCFGLVDKKERLLGAMFLFKTSKLEPIPYIHSPSDYYDEKGDVVYVSLFVVKETADKKQVAYQLYKNAENVTLLKLLCKLIMVVIYSSPLEEETLIGNNYEKTNKQFEWEIYPGKKVLCWIYYKELLLKKAFPK